MNRHQIEGNLKRWKGTIREKWGRWTHQYSKVLSGKFSQLVGKIQSRYGKMRK